MLKRDKASRRINLTDRTPPSNESHKDEHINLWLYLNFGLFCRGFKALKQIIKLQYTLGDFKGMMDSYRQVGILYIINESDFERDIV